MIYLKRLEQRMINFFKFWVKLDWSHLIYQVHHLTKVQEYEAEVPGESIGRTNHVPCPYGVEHEC